MAAEGLGERESYAHAVGFPDGTPPNVCPSPPSQQLPWRATKPSPLPLLRVMSAWHGPAGCPSPPSPPSPSCDRRYCSSRGEARTLTGKETPEPRDPQRDYGPRQSLVEFESPFGARVDPLPRLTCRSTPQKDAGVVPSWWHERHAAWLRRERGGDDARGLAPTGYCYDCSVGAEMIRDGCASNSSQYYPPGITCGVDEAPFAGPYPPSPDQVPARTLANPIAR